VSLYHIKFRLVFIFFFVYSVSYSQILKGAVKSDKGENIDIASMLIMEYENPNQISEFSTIRNGEFSFTLKRAYKKIIINIKAIGYLDKIEIIENPHKDKVYIFDFKLKYSDTLGLKEIIITSKRAAIQVKEDTVSYNVSAFRDGSERKIEDVLKKLPGIEVNEKSGEIKYNGKSVETVNIDGDNLFGSSYSLGTKNINVDMVEQVQAIENYSENHLLKGIESGDKVALNLKIKKGKYDFSGNSDTGAGLFSDLKPSILSNSTVLGINTKLKSFSTLAYNNLGINYSPFNYSSSTLTPSQKEDREFFASKLISEPQFGGFLNEDRTNINSQLFGSLNNILKLSKRISVKTNIFYVNDKIKSERFYESIYSLDNLSFKTTDEISGIKKPTVYRGDLELRVNTSKKTFLEYNFRIKKEDISSLVNTTLNNQKRYISDLFTSDLFIKNNVLFTKKISRRQVVQFTMNQSYNKIPQNLSVILSNFENSPNSTYQKSEFIKSYFEVKSSIIGGSKKMKYSLNLGGTSMNSPYFSDLKTTTLELDNSRNENKYTKTGVYQSSLFQFLPEKWKFNLGYSFTYLNQTLNDSSFLSDNTVNNIIFEPFISIKYKLSNISSVLLKGNYMKKPNAEQYFFSNQVLVNSRNTIKNIPNLTLQSYQNLSLIYSHLDLYNQFQLNTGIHYQLNKGQFFQKYMLSPYITQIEFFFLPRKNSNINTDISLSKFLPVLSSTFKISSSFSLSQYSNIVNNSDLRSNLSNSLLNDISIKTAFDIPLNFETKLHHQSLVSKSAEQQSFSNQSIQYTFRTIYNLNSLFNIVFSADYYLPNAKSPKNNYLFIDAMLRFRPNRKSWEVGLNCKNIANESSFNQIQTSDFSTNISRSNILSRYFLLSLSYSF
jgi:hypothetical protein